MRACVSRPDGQIELLSVADPIKAAKVPLFRDVVESAEREGESLFQLWLKVKDGEETAADAKRKGVRIAHSREGEYPSIVPHFEEVFFKQ